MIQIVERFIQSKRTGPIKQDKIKKSLPLKPVMKMYQIFFPAAKPLACLKTIWSQSIGF